MQRRQLEIICSFILFFIAVFVIQWFQTGKLDWTVVGVAVLFITLIFLSSKREIQKIIGEYPHPKRTRFIAGLTWFLATILSLPFVLYLVDQLNKPEPDFKNFAVFIIIPILFGIAVETFRIPNITDKSQSGLLCIIKKLASSIVLFIIFIPFFILTNKLQIDINSPDFYHPESLFRGFIVWAMVFCFYVGLFLFLFAVIDFIIVIKDLSIKKNRKPRQTRKHST